MANANPPAPTCTIIDLGALGAESLAVASGINARGQVVGGSGTATGLQRPVLWEPGSE